MQLVPKPNEFLDADGKPVQLGDLKVGDKVYKKIGDQLVAATVISLNPLTVATR